MLVNAAAIARVLPDVPALGRTFDYLIPAHMAPEVRVGTVVRVPLHGRKVGGWVVALPGHSATDRPLQPLSRVTGWGPSAEVLELAEWAAWRWAGRTSALLATASPPGAVRSLPDRPKLPESHSRSAEVPPTPTGGPRTPEGSLQAIAAEAFSRPLTVVRLAPSHDVGAFVLAAARFGDALVVVPSVAVANLVAAGLKQRGWPVALLPREWARAAAGGCVAIGARAAAWGPRPQLGAVLVVDEHDEAHQQGQAPTWNARDVAVERARRAGVPCVLTSPCPSLESLALVETSQATLLTVSRTEERAGWPMLEVVDRRSEPPGAGLYSPALVALVRTAAAGRRVLCVLNTKGRTRLSACGACGELVRCEHCGGALGADGGALACRRCGVTREPFCAMCGSTRLKALRVGVTRAREELELLAGQAVAEVTGDSDPGPPPDATVLIGTEAVLHRVAGAAAVAFLDFDQELAAPRYRASEEALGLLARAARLVGGRHHGGRILVQTRLPGHESLDAARHADPGRLALVERARRAALRLPPEAALAAVSGPAASAFVAALQSSIGQAPDSRASPLDIAGPTAAGRWLVRAPEHRQLCDALAEVPRPPGRLRVEVDPLRV